VSAIFFFARGEGEPKHGWMLDFSSPRSHRAMVLELTESFRPSSAWLKRSASRSRFRLAPSTRAASAVLLRDDSEVMLRLGDIRPRRNRVESADNEDVEPLEKLMAALLAKQLYDIHQAATSDSEIDLAIGSSTQYSSPKDSVRS
jgi:hypothetical protein